MITVKCLALRPYERQVLVWTAQSSSGSTALSSSQGSHASLQMYSYESVLRAMQESQ
jgi:hypothetical protein